MSKRSAYVAPYKLKITDSCEERKECRGITFACC